MLVLKTNITSKNQNLPVLGITPAEVNILKMNPTAWLSGNSGVVLNGTAVISVADRTGKYTWSLVSPTTAHPPRQLTSGSRKVLRFGIGVSGDGIGALKKAGDEPTYPEDGVFTLFALIRIPLPNTSGYTATGGNLCGNNSAEPDLARFRFGSDSYMGNEIYYNHGSKSSADTSNYPLRAPTAADFRDNAWHILVITARANAHTLEWDGAVLQQKAIAVKSFATDESRRMTIGSADSPFNHSFMGHVAELILIPGALSDDNKADVVQFMNDVKSAL